MSEFSVDLARPDPYANFRFRVSWEGRAVAGFSRLGGLAHPTQVIEHRDAGDPSSSRRTPGSTDFEPITLERGMTHDIEFQEWASKLWSFDGAGTGELSLQDVRKELRIELRNEAGEVAVAYVVHRAWVSEYTALPDLDANANAVAVESLKLENEGWERDPGVAEPAEPSATD